jgi:chemotaxis protein histidine kinase CheA
MTDQNDTIFFTPPNPLRNKVKTEGANVIDLDLLEKAQDVLDSMGDDYLEWVKTDLVKIEYSYEDLVEATEDEKREEFLKEVFSTAHDMKGQGGTFGYDLVTQVANHLCRLIERINASISIKMQNEAIRIHIDALQLIFKNELSGDGGESGIALLQGIETMGAKLVPWTPGES